MELPVDVEVHCTDGPVGKSSAIVLHPDTREVTHLAVRTKGWLYEEYLVPLSYVSASTPQRITLSCTAAELAQMPPFERTVLLGMGEPDSPATDAELAMLASYAAMPGSGYPGQTPPLTRTEEQLPAGELSIHPGADVEATDGRVGQVHEVIVAGEGNLMTHLVLREGHLWGKKDVTIPLDQIARIEQDVVYLKLDKAAVERLPSVRAR